MTLPQISSVQEDEAFYDTVLSIDEHRIEGRVINLKCIALDSTETVGFEVRTKLIFPAALGEVDGELSLLPGSSISEGVSLGSKTAGFLRALKAGYQLQSEQTPREDSTVTTTAIPLHDEEIDLRNSPVHLKLFFDQHPDENRYWEAYLNIDLPNRLVFFKEKDQEYRQPLLDTFNEAWGAT